ncbi:MAG TPA: fumarylacetoacetate hydrolase family protein [Burkholderiaceae bacterium]|nr:fumarylacetoacetate hydrolase family protein [Burkholderiaceae bacterium]
MSFVVTPPVQASVPVSGENGRFPVRRVYCIGRNYAAHAREMGHDPDREPPFFFCKPADAVWPVAPGETRDLPYPPKTSDLHHEVELVVAIGKGGANIPVASAMQHVYGYAVGLDMTRRDRQQDMKDLARPWELGKAFDGSAPVGFITPAAQAGDIEQARISLHVNGQPKQDGNVNQMIWSIAESISYLSEYFRLEAGDLLFTGTPEGVGPVVTGDVLQASLDGVDTLSVRLV